MIRIKIKTKEPHIAWKYVGRKFKTNVSNREWRVVNYLPFTDEMVWRFEDETKEHRTETKILLNEIRQSKEVKS